MTALDEYRRTLQDLDDPAPFLLERSGLPGPRANIELAQAMADVGTRKQFDRFLSFTAGRAPVGSREAFLAFCTAIGFGRLAAEGDRTVLVTLRKLASDPRWRVREGVALGLAAARRIRHAGAVDGDAGLGHGERLRAASRSGGSA
jgi:hypothetical protein